MTLQIEVAVAPALAERAALDNNLALFAGRIGEQVSGVAQALGIPTETEVHIGPSRAPEAALLTIRIEGRLCRFPRRLPSQAAAALRGAWPDTDDLEDPDGWLDTTTPDEAREVVASCCAQVVATTPSLLLTDEVVGSYATALARATPAGRGPIETTDLAPLLRDVVDLRIAVGDTGRIAALLGDTEDLDDLAQRTELVIAALASDTVGVVVPAPVAAQLGVGDSEDPDDILGFVASGLFEETGLVMPRLVLEDSHALPDRTFAVRINDITTLPCPLIPSDSCLVNDTPERLRLLDVEGRPATILATEQPGAIAPLGDRGLLEGAGLTTWTTSGHIALQLAVELRRHMASVVSQDRLFAQLDILEMTNPQLVPAARGQLHPAALTRLVRRLAQDHVRLRHMPTLLERLVDLPADELGWERYGVVDDPVHSPVPGHDAPPAHDRIEQFVRTGLRYEIAAQAARGDVLVAYLLDPGLEARLSDTELTEEVEEGALTALREELRHLPQTALTPVLLTSSRARARLQALTRSALPTLIVLAHDDLPPECLVQPVARIMSD